MTEFNQLREENRRIVDQLKIEEQKRLNEMKESSFSVQEKMLLEQAEIQARSESEKRDMAHRHQKDVQALQDKVENYIHLNNEQLDKHMKAMRVQELAYSQLQD